MFNTFTDSPRGTTSNADERTSSSTTARHGLVALTNPGVLVWAAVSCLLLLIGGLGPQAHVAALSLGGVFDSTITTAYVVKGAIYVLLAIAGGTGLARYAARPDSAARSLRLSMYAGLIGIACAIFTFSQIGSASLEEVSAGWGLYVVLAASVSLLISAGVLVRRHGRQAA